ncbi:hypothetical protein BN961_02180 [Afipia felis]|uniref:Uncharacterized protein n=1 Tax=Afipia felis TaxID=1035 RepID=A0A090MR97_AFIFE|nr:hypothetical protein [Afipia felis]CEG08762.1 hypothetical protein BN961_02180 [Afipia felis]
MTKKAAQPKKPKQTSRRGLAIVHRKFGCFWAREVFDNEQTAKAYFDRYWDSFPAPKSRHPSWKEYRLVKVRQSLVYTGEVQT